MDAIPLFHPTSFVSDAVVTPEIQDGAGQPAPEAGAGATPTPAIISGENTGNNNGKRAIKSNSKFKDYQIDQINNKRQRRQTRSDSPSPSSTR